MSDTADLFCGRLDHMIDLRHPLAVLCSRMSWQELEASVSHLFAKKVGAGKFIDEADLFGGISKLVGAGAPDRTVDDIAFIFIKKFVRVAKSVGNDQVPAISDQVVGEFCFARFDQ